MKFKAIARRGFTHGRHVTQTLLIMKLTAFFLLAACLQVSAKGYAQQITLSEKNAPLQKVFKQIQKQAPYDFLYNSELLQQAGKISIDVRDASIEQVLQLCLKDKPLTYVIIDKTIVIKQKTPELPKRPDAVETPPAPLTGIVVDENGKPVAGVSIMIKWPSGGLGVTRFPQGTQTDAKGEFTLQAITGNAILYISSIGYAPLQMPVTAQSNHLRIVLTPAETSLSEMVVTGYSTKKASEITGSVQSVSGDELRKGVSTANTLAMLKGKATGLYIVETGGSVTNRGQVLMRGQASLNDASNTNYGPLIVMDGIITTAANLQDIVNPGDIESITILKDAASTAIYGSRAAQGVIVVTTKHGASGKLSVNLDMNYGQVQNNRLVNFMNTPELTTHINKYMQALYAAPSTTGGPSSLQTTYGSFQNYFNTTRIYTDADLNTNTDWNNKAFFTNGNQSSTNLSLASGNDKTRFFGAVNWTTQDGTLIDDNLDRKSVRFNIDQKISNKLSFTLNTNALIDKYTQTNSENQYYLFEPWVPSTYANGHLADSVPNYLYNPTGARGVQYYDDPLYSHSYNTVLTQRQSYFATGKLKYDITPWLSVQSSNNFQYIYNNVNAYKDPRTYRGRWDGAASSRVWVNGELSITDTKTRYFLTSNMINFNRSFGQHNITALVGEEFGKSHTETFAASAYNNAYPGERNLGAFLSYGTATNVQNGTTATPSSLAPVDKASFSVFSEINDSYREKYFGALSLRRDASTNFGVNNRYGTFYSVSGGWMLSKENFMQHIRPVSNLKLRASYGTSGREAGADYLNFTVYQDQLQYNSMTTTGSTIQRLANDQITWETTYTTNLGVDISLWKRINLSMDYYNRRSSGLLQTVLLPSYIGFPSQVRNVGDLTNKGLELSLTTNNIVSRDFSWTTEFNISFNRNRLTKIYGDSLKDGYSGAYYRHVGDDINALKAIKYDGVNPDNGRPIFERVMSDKSIVLVDSIPLAKQDGYRAYRNVGSATPKFFGGFTNTFRYKGISLSMLFNFVYGNKIMNNGVRNFANPTAWQSGFNLLQPNGAMRFWQGPGDKSANYPNYYDVDARGNSAFLTRGATNISSSLLYVDASYIRLRNVRLSYEMPAGLLHKARIASATVYLSADNIFVLKSKDLYAADPEGATVGGTSNSFGGTGVASAMPRRIMAGISLSF
jgi:TonB-linked SusC/RagA family outer membrane protein